MRLRHAAILAGLALAFMSGTARAAYLFDIKQSGSDIVVLGHGSLITTGLTSITNDNNSFNGALYPAGPLIFNGSDTVDSFYRAEFDNTKPFGPGDGAQSDFSLGPQFIFGVATNGDGTFNALIGVPGGYVSSAPSADSRSVYNNATFASLGVTIGTFTYTYSAGDVRDSITINVGGSVNPVPLPASAPMFGAALLALGVVGYGVKRKKAAAA